MVVKAGLLGRHPAQEPRVDVVVAVQAHVHTLALVVADEALPEVGAAGELLGEGAQLGRIEVAIGAAALREPGRELGVAHRSWDTSLEVEDPGRVALGDGPVDEGPSASSERRSGLGSMTGTSVPSTICSAP